MTLLSASLFLALAGGTGGGIITFATFLLAGSGVPGLLADAW